MSYKINDVPTRSKSVLPECKYLPIIVKAGVGFVFSTNEQSGVFRKSCSSASQGKQTLP